MIGDMAHKYRNRNKEFTMANHLVIVESPAKVKTIKKFLGSNYEVDASGGHVRDLPKSQLGFDPEHDYEPKYITIRGKGDVLAKLRKEVKKADKIYLATDPDREGEAISWHLMKALKLDELKNKQVYRISFNVSKRSGYQSGQCTADQTYVRPYGWLPYQSASLGKSKKRFKCRPCPVCSPSYDL